MGLQRRKVHERAVKTKKHVSTQHQRKPFLLTLHVAERFCSCRALSPNSNPKFGRFQGASPVLLTGRRRSSKKRSRSAPCNKMFRATSSRASHGPSHGRLVHSRKKVHEHFNKIISKSPLATEKQPTHELHNVMFCNERNGA